jgi:hypothetical protein
MHFEKLINFIAGKSDLFESIVGYFKNIDKIVTLDGSNFESFNKKIWPKSCGVYIIRLKSSNEVLYVGMCGKVRAEDGQVAYMNNSIFGDRVGRWTPYVFQNEGLHKGHWECGPTFKSSTKKPTFNPTNYRHKFPFIEIKIECICLDSDWIGLTPTFLETLLLQVYLTKNSRLPIGNNEL